MAAGAQSDAVVDLTAAANMARATTEGVTAPKSACAHMRPCMVIAAIFAIVASAPSHAAGGPVGIDRQWNRDTSGIWSDHYQKGLEVGAIAVEIGGALALGNERRLGHAFWQSIDSTAIASAGAMLLKSSFSRARPDDGVGPDRWFQGSCCKSFPSGEVTLQAAFVTPLILQYRSDHRWIWALEALPLYDGIARLKAQKHWQTDVLAGWALGTASGVWASRRGTPLSVRLLPSGLTIGFARRY